MKKLLIITTLLASSFATQAECSITSKRQTNISSIFKKYGGWNINEKKFNKICEKLNKANAGVEIIGSATVLDGKSIAWVSLMVFDKKSDYIISDYSRNHTITNQYPSQDRANEDLISIMSEALEQWDELDLAIKRLEERRVELKAIYSK